MLADCIIHSLPSPALPLGAGVFTPLAIMVLCVVAGIGTILMLPGKREASWPRIGGLILLVALLIIAALIVRQAQGFGVADVYFWLFSAIAVEAAVRVISHSKPVYSALYFVLVVIASAGLFVLLWAEFMAAALILIYAGAILVTYVFVIMLASQARTGSMTDAQEGAEYDRVSREPLLASAAGFLLMGVVLFVIFEKGQGLAKLEPQPVKLSTAAPTAAPAGTAVVTEIAPGTIMAAPSGVRELGDYLFSQQLVTLELAGLLLTIAMVGAIVIARRQTTAQEAVAGTLSVTDEEPADHVDAAATPVNDNPHSIPVTGTRNHTVKAYPEQ